MGTPPAPVAPRTAMRQTPPPSRMAPGTPNQGGTISGSAGPGLKFSFKTPESAGYTAAGSAGRENSGGSITKDGVTTNYGRSPGYTAPAPVVPTPRAPSPTVARPEPIPAPITAGPTPQAAPLGPTATQPPAQTEAANPLSGDTTTQTPGTTAPVNPGQALGFSARGNATAKGQDANGIDPLVGGVGIYARRFSTPGSAQAYHAYTQRLFENAQPA